jgi:CRISPR/Cas system-associated exonuclease Cas4 (RecB family)
MALASISDLNQPVEDIQQYVDIAKGLSRMYDNFLENFEEDRGERPPGIHASEVSKCMRQAYYSLVNLEKKNSVSLNMRRRFHVGHAVHSMAQKELHKMAAMAQAEELAKKNGWYLEFADEVKVNPESQAMAAKYQIQSSCDGVFTFRELEHGEVVLRVGLEIKTEAPAGYEKLNAPKEDHIDQVHVYMACLDLPLLWFFYMNKGNQNTTPSQHPWLITFNPAIWNRLELRAAEVIEYNAKGKPPPREEGNHCGFCPYTWECKPPTQNRGPRNVISVRRP